MAREMSDFGGTFTYGDATGPCSIGTMGFGGRLVAGGISPHSEMTIVIRKSVLAAAPVANDPITLKGPTVKQPNLKIAAEGVIDGGYFWEVICNDANEGA